MGTDFLSRGNRRWSVWEGEQCCAVRARFAGCARGIGRDCRSETRALPFNFLIHDSHNTFAILRILPESRSNFAIPPRLILVQPLCLPPPHRAVREACTPASHPPVPGAACGASGALTPGEKMQHQIAPLILQHSLNPIPRPHTPAISPLLPALLGALGFRASPPEPPRPSGLVRGTFLPVLLFIFGT